MFRFIKNNIQSDISLLTIIIITISLGTWLYISYTTPEDIHYKYNGIKYKAGNSQIWEPIVIEIEGKYKKGAFGAFDEFIGKIKIGNEIFDSTKRGMKFNNYSMDILKNDTDSYGNIHIGNKFEKLTITIFEQLGNRRGGFSYRDGFLISAPCTDRKEAVKVSNELIQKFLKSIVIE